tara:strand:- start:9 stop:1061 length:1053 start_codon:yes stop_codon:yes gene_type:complete
MASELNHFISVIIPVFNAEKFLQTSVESVINQTYNNIEVILVNDGSSDDSGKICDNYSDQYSRIKVFHKENTGPAAARNLGIERASGELIFFLDADDYISLDALEMLEDIYRKTSANIVVGNFIKIRPNNSKTNFDPKLTDNVLLDKKGIVNYVRNYLKKPNKYSLFSHCWGRLFNTLNIRKNNIRFDENLYTFEDVKFNFEYLLYIDELFFLNKPIYHHVLLENFTSATFNMNENPEKLFGYQKALEKAGIFLGSHNLNDNLISELGHAYMVYTIIQLIRLCGQLTKNNYDAIYSFIDDFIRNPPTSTNIEFYKPSRGDSKIIPILIRFKLTKLLIQFCNNKAKQRYKH